ncbi:LPS export ABC transporter permease LptF [Terrarubrum flagellatum]|uniref:LPS export ABC transporter permease LptF n=1 Tax=Terrirubrum flagellatum TaxID=2895980 RepID=UPI00314545D0
MSRFWGTLGFGLIERYVFRMALGATLACTLVLTAVIWITQALRELDLLTSKGQTIMMFLAITGLTLPALVTIIGPVAMFIAIIFTLNKLNSDSELIVISAAGAPPRTIFKPLATLAIMTCVMVAAMTIYIMPASFRVVRDLFTKIQADVISNIVKEGQFVTLDKGVVFHYRERAGQTLLGVFIQDRRDPEKVSIYLAEKGQTVEANGTNYLILEKGSVQRLAGNAQDASIIVFQRYAIDLSEMVAAAEAAYQKPREQTTLQLLNPDPAKPPPAIIAGRYRSELHDRLSSPLYPFAFAVIAFAALGSARTTRQGRGISIAAAVFAMAAVRGAGFIATSAIAGSATFIPAAYLTPLVGGALSFALIWWAGDFTRLDLGALLRPIQRLLPRPAQAGA